MGVNLNHLPRMRQRETKWSGAPLIRNRHRPERLEVVAERSGDRPSVETRAFRRDRECTREDPRRRARWRVPDLQRTHFAVAREDGRKRP
jgi:hypothetical protein